MSQVTLSTKIVLLTLTISYSFTATTPNPLQSYHKNTPLQNKHITECAEGPPHAFKFLGKTIASLTGNQTAGWPSPCFNSNKVTSSYLPDGTITLEFESTEKNHIFCMDTYLISSQLDYQTFTPFMTGNSTVTYNFSNSTETDIVHKFGLKIIRMCDPWYYIVPDISESVSQFLNDILTIPNWLSWAKPNIERKMKDINYDWQTNYIGLDWPQRNAEHEITADILKMFVKSGDTFSVHDGSGLGSLIVWATGGPVAHSVIAIWNNYTLWIIEADIDPGLTKFPIDQWLAENNDQIIIWQPLSDESRKKFDAQKAWDWFVNGIEGLPYGMENMIYSCLDTPDSNWPAITDQFDVLWAIHTVNSIDSDLLKTAMFDGLNKRQNTTDLGMIELIEESARRNMTIGDVMAIPEGDGWLYDGNTPRYICSALTAKILHVGGVFDDLIINPFEQTPKDVHMLGIYDDAPLLPWQCKQNDPELKRYCQVSGPRKLLDTGIYNSVKPYSHMNERCPSIAPDFFRPDGC